MKISPEELDLIIVELKRNGRVFISLDEMVEIFRVKKKLDQKFIVVTLDDGYKDNLDFGFSVFDHQRVPFCIYVTNCFPNRTTNLWWYALENLIQNNPSLRLPDGKKLDNSTLKEKKRNFLLLRSLVLANHFKKPLDYFNQLGEMSFDIVQERENKCISWGELKELSKSPLATIGCHTYNHLPLSRLNEEEVASEIVESKNELEINLKRKINHFAFPFGSRKEASSREYAIAKSIGFDTVVTTVHGHLYRHDSLQQLDRIFIYPMQNNATTLKREMFWNAKNIISTFRKLVKI